MASHLSASHPHHTVECLPSVPLVVRIALSIPAAVVGDVETAIFLDLIGEKGCSKGLREGVTE